MNPRLRLTLQILTATLLLVSCASPGQQQPTPLPSATGPVTVPVTAEPLLGVWARILASNRNPDITAHYWLRLTPEGTFALTTNKMQFETNVNQRGTYSLLGDQLTLNAEAGSQQCEGQSAIYQAVMYEDGYLEFKPIDVPCEKWLNMGPGGLGEETIWVKLSD